MSTDHGAYGASPTPGAAGLFTAITRYFRDRRHARGLESLPDHILRDIGLTRADLPRAKRSGRLF